MDHRNTRAIGVFSLIVVLVMLAVAAGCTSSPAPSTTAQPAASVDTGKQWVLKTAAFTPQAGASRPAAMSWWANEVEKRTNGKVRVEWYWAESLLPANDILDGVGAGTAHLGETSGSYAPAKLALSMFLSSPAIAATTYAGCSAFWDAYQQIPEFSGEYRKVNVEVVIPMGLESHQFMTTKEVRTLNDLKGLKIRSVSEFAVLMKELGVVPVTMPAPDIYMGIQKGTLDGHHHPVENIFKYKTYEVAKYYTVANLGTSTAMSMILNQDVWKSLSPDIQKVFRDLAPEYIKVQTKMADEATDSQLATIKAAGVKLSELSKTEQELIRTAAHKTQDAYASQLDAKGLPGTKTLNFVRERVKYYEAQAR